MELLGFNEELDGVRLNVHEGDERELHVDQVILGVLLLQSINQMSIRLFWEFFSCNQLVVRRSVLSK